jgi:hypothetical protein
MKIVQERKLITEEIRITKMAILNAGAHEPLVLSFLNLELSTFCLSTSLASGL